jgi:hypothetical protein
MRPGAAVAVEQVGKERRPRVRAFGQARSSMQHSLYEQPFCCREASLLRHCRLHSQRIRAYFGYMCRILGAHLRNVNSMLHYT